MSAQEGSYAALGEQLLTILERLRGITINDQPILLPGDAAFIEYLGSTELPATDDIVQSLSLQAMTMSREVVQVRRFCDELQAGNSILHGRMIDAQAAAELATNLAEKATRMATASREGI